MFIFDESILAELPKEDARVTFIHELLSKIQEQLALQGKSLAVFHGKPIAVFKQLISEHSISTVYTNNDYEPYARKRDKEINQLLKEHGIDFKTSKDHVIFEKSEVVKDDGLPYVVYTPYSKKWKEKFKTISLPNYPSENLLDKIALHSYPFLSLTDIGFETSSIKITPFDVSDKLVDQYESKITELSGEIETSKITEYKNSQIVELIPENLRDKISARVSGKNKEEIEGFYNSFGRRKFKTKKDNRSCRDRMKDFNKTFN